MFYRVERCKGHFVTGYFVRGEIIFSLFLFLFVILSNSAKRRRTRNISLSLGVERRREREVEVASYFTTDNTLIVSSLAMFKLVEPPSAVSAISTRQRNKESKPRVLALISCKFYDLRRIRFPHQAYIRPSRGVSFRPLRRRTTYLPTYLALLTRCGRKNSGEIKLSYNPLITSSIGSNLVCSPKAVTSTLLQFLLRRFASSPTLPPFLTPLPLRRSRLSSSVNSRCCSASGQDHSSLTKTNTSTSVNSTNTNVHQTLTIQTVAPVKPDAQ